MSALTFLDTERPGGIYPLGLTTLPSVVLRSKCTLCLVFVWFVVSWTGYSAAQDAAAPPSKDAAEVVRVAIYKDDIPVCGAAASPDYLARLLEAPAFSTAFLNSKQLADARSLILSRFQDETKGGRVRAWQDHAGLTHSS